MYNFIAFILIVFPLVIIHEFAHLLVGQFLGAKPKKFAIGFGKPLFSFYFKGVEYSLRPFPLGGFVEFGTTQFPKLEKNKEELASWKWIFISLAGPFSNFLFTYLVIAGLYLLGGEKGFLMSFVDAFYVFIDIFTKYLELFGSLFSGSFLESVSGPVGIAKASGEAINEGFMGYIKMSISLSFALGFMNLIPLTVLDGGRALISIFETIFRTKINEKVFNYTSIVSISLLFMLLIFATFKDLNL